jgi:hypothetical protein
MVSTEIDLLKIKIGYIGVDKSYWENIKSSMTSYFDQSILGLGEQRKKIEIEFKTISSDEEDEFQYMKFILTRQLGPKILYIDFSKPTKANFNLIKLLRECELTKNITIMCLFREETHYDNVIKALHNGAQLTQFKSHDNWFAIYNVFKMTYPAIVLNKTYAQVELTEKTTLQNEMRIQYLNTSRILLESNLEIPNNKIMEFKWEMDEKVIPQKIFKFIELSEEDSHYNCPFLYKYQPLFINKNQKKQNLFNKEKLRLEAVYENIDSSKLNFIDEDTDISPELVLYDKKNNKLNEKYIKEEELGDKELRELYRGYLLNWITKHNKRVSPLQLKVLVIDRKMHLLTQNTSFEEYECSIRMQDYLKDYSYEILNYKPVLIAIQLDNTDKEDKPNETNFAVLEKIIFACQKIYDYFPIIILFNCPSHKSINLQHNFEYHQLIAHKGQINIKIIQLLIKSLTDKKNVLQENKAIVKMKEYAKEEFKFLSDLKVSDFINANAHFTGTEKNSSLWYELNVELTNISESEIEFNSKHLIPEKSLLRFESPILFYVSTIHHTDKKNKDSDKNNYKAIIHSITHKRSELLRQYINKLLELKNQNGGFIPPSLINTLKVQIKVKDK